MTLQEVDESLAAWNSRIGAAAQNLMDLHDQPAYQQLTGSSGAEKVVVEGVTAARVGPALATMDTLFQHFGLLSEMLGRATALRSNMPGYFGDKQRLREIETVLCGKSIALPVVEIPLAQRSLLSSAAHSERITPAELLDAMVRSFQEAKDAVMAVDAAWSQMDQLLGGARSQIEALRERAGRLGINRTMELNRAEAALKQMQARVQSDPLGSAADLDAEVMPALVRVKTDLDAREQLQQQVESQIAASRALFREVVKRHSETAAACEEARSRVSGCENLPAPQPDHKIEALHEWLCRLEEKRAQGVLQPIVVGLRNWQSAAQEALAREQAACAANRSPIETRNELRGRLDALKAKARACGVAEDRTLAQLAQQAEALLYTRPTPLDRASDAVVQYERTLNGRSSRSAT